MRIHSLTIENCKSYRLTETLSLDKNMTLLVGPNAGGKSNTLDILTIILRKFFLQTYTLSEGRDAGVLYQDIGQPNLFHPLLKFLDKNSEREADELRVDLILEVGQTDVKNVATILDKRSEFERVFSGYRNKPIPNLNFLNEWNIEMFAAGQTAEYTVRDMNLSKPAGIGGKFKEYLQYLHLFILLARDLNNVDLSPTFLYFSPYRSASPEDLNASLANDNFFNLLHNYFSTTSRGTTSLIKIATVFFAEKKRRLEVGAREAAYGPAWSEDEDVMLASRYMRRLGYEWELRLIDPNKNTYEIALTRDKRELLISRASSGEKEILNFLFGIFALRTRGGLLVIDEPELHLHPRWQAVLRDLFRELANATENQFLLSSHSPVFITPETINNVRRVAKDDKASTRLISVCGEREAVDSRSLLHIVNSHNNERIFFADRVVLVEGVQDRIVFKELIERYREAAEINDVVEVVEVHGKSNFDRYTTFLRSLGVFRWIISDLDYGVDLKRNDIGDLITIPYDKIDTIILQAKKSKDRAALSEVLGDAVGSGDMNALKEIWRYIEGRFARLRDPLDKGEESRLRAALDDLRREGIYVLSKGEIEDYLPLDNRSLDGTIELLQPQSLSSWFESIADDERLSELEDIILAILGIPDLKKSTTRSKVIDKLQKRAENDATAERVGAEEDEAVRGTEISQ